MNMEGGAVVFLSSLHRKNRARSLLYSLLLSTAVAVTGCSQSEQVQSNPGQQQEGSTERDHKQATILLSFKTGSLDPHNNATPIKAGIVETLVRLDEHLELKPWLATKWEAKDERTWVFTIRDGVTFQDGTKLDAAAVKASLERGIAVNKPLDRALKIASMEASGQQLTIVTTEPHPALPSEMVNPYTSVVSVQAEKNMGTEAFNNAPVGTGPFKVKQFTPNMEIALERYDGYWDGAAKLDEVSVKFNEDGNVRALALQSQEADIVYHLPAESVAAIEKDSRLLVESVPGLRVHYLLYNQQKPQLQDVRVRKAIDLMIDRDSIVKNVMLGHAAPANGPFPTGLPFGNTDAVQKQNLGEARKLLEEAGYTAGADGRLLKGGKPLTLELLTYKGRPELPLIAQLVQSDAAKVGVTLQIKTVENIDTYLRENKDWDVTTYSNLTAPRGDGGFFLNSAFVPGGSLNPTDMNSTTLHTVIAQLNATADPAKRVELTKKAVQTVKEEVLHSYAVYPNIIVGVNKRVTDWKPGADEYYIVTNNMDVK
jgi:peptide/nickel transport system substrate-binding protein